MSAVINYSGLTLAIEEARSASECVFKSVLLAPELGQIHEVRTGVESDKRIPIFGTIGLIGSLDSGTCTPNVFTDQIPTSEKVATPKLISGRLLHCEAQLPDNLKFWKKSRIAANTWEDIDNEQRAFIEDTLMAALKKSVPTVAEFAATTLSPIGDGAGDQTMTAGANKLLLNMLNGMWAQIKTDLALAPNNKMFRYTIDANSAVTKELQFSQLPADAGLKAMRAMYNGIDSKVFDRPGLVIELTKSLYDNWLDMLEDKSLVFTLQKAEQGSTSMTYRGIPIIVRKDWDDTIKTYFNNGTILDNPHRGLMYNIGNIPILTSDTESLSTLKSAYDGYQQKHYIDFAYKLDCKILEDELIAVAI